MDSERVIKLIELHKEWVSKQRSFSPEKLAGIGYAFDFAINTILVVEASEEEPADIPELPEGMVCDGCDD